MTKLEQIKAQCRSILGLSIAALEGPWLFGAESGEGFLYSEKDSEYISGFNDVAMYAQDKGVENLCFVSQARTFSPAAAQALLTAITMLQEVAGQSQDGRSGLAIASRLCEETLEQICQQWPEQG